MQQVGWNRPWGPDGPLESFFSIENKPFDLVQTLVTGTFFPLQEPAIVDKLTLLDIRCAPLVSGDFTVSFDPPLTTKRKRWVLACPVSNQRKVRIPWDCCRSPECD